MMTTSEPSRYTISQYLLHRLKEVGIHHLFGVPGDYVLEFLDEVLASPLKWVGTCNELNAGYAADGYARMNGAGAAVVTYGVGGLSILNAVAGAYAERVPLIVISGAPPAHRRDTGALVHHLIADYYVQLEIFKKVTVDAVILTNADSAPDEIDRVIMNAIINKLPVFIELPVDMAGAACRPPRKVSRPLQRISDKESLAECVEETARLLDAAENPVVRAGVELLRFGLGPAVLNLVETVELPFSTMLSSKCVLPEMHPQFIGIYQGNWSRETVRRQVESSDCLLSLGVWVTDLDTGLFSMNLDNRRVIDVGDGDVRIGNHYYHDVHLKDFIHALSRKARPRMYVNSHPDETRRRRAPFIPEKGRTLTASRLYECVNSFLDDHMVLLAEPGDAFCAAPDFHIEEAENFIVQVYYTSIGFCTPAALGVAMARPKKRPVVLTGDGAFQMTAQEISTLIRWRSPAVVILINNDGYLIERMLHQDGLYNDIQMWNYASLPAAFGGGDAVIGIRADNEEELAQAFATAAAEKDKFIFIEARLPNRDCSEGLSRLGAALSQSHHKK
jgi:TPP-dependent 2-oxoacid decarboxylase